MQDNMAGFEELINCPATLKILLALLAVEEAYSFQLTRMTGHHSRMIDRAMTMLIAKKMVKVVPAKIKFKNIGDFYALTPHGRVIANSLHEIQEAIENAQ